MTPTEFLLARIAEDEAVARASTPSPWAWDGEDLQDSIVSTVVGPNREDHYVITTDSRVYGPNDATAEHIMAWAPHRVLAECAAKRQIVDRWRYFDAGREPYHADMADGILSTIRALAAVYETHPDYDPEWSLT